MQQKRGSVTSERNVGGSSMAQIWAVDDEPDMTDLYRTLLEEEGGYAARTTNDPQEVLGWISKGDRPDLLILDHHMPGIDGLTLAAAVRQAGYTGPILMISGSRTVTVVPIFITAVMKKPLEIEPLLALVARLLAERLETGAAHCTG